MQYMVVMPEAPLSSSSKASLFLEEPNKRKKNNVLAMFTHAIILDQIKNLLLWAQNQMHQALFSIVAF